MKQKRSPIPYLLLAAYGLLSLGIWFVLDGERREQLKDLSIAEAETVSIIVQRDLILRIASVNRMAKRWELLDGLSEELFTADAQNYLDDMPGFRALSYNDEGNIARFVIPKRNSRAIGRNIADISESRREALARARSSDGPAMTSPIQLLDETAGFIIFVPVRERLKFVGTLGAVFQTETWLSSLISDIPQRSEQIPFVRQIRLAGDVIYQSDGWTDAEGSRTISAPPVDLFGQTLDVALRRQPGAGLTTRDRRPEIVAFFLVCIGIAVAGIIASMQVATDARNWALAANQNLNAANRTLAEEIEVRREAETRALEASEAKSRFLATMSHEVRTPINAIMGMFELIQAAGVPERQRRQASVGRAAAERLLDQLTAVLEMSKLRAKAVTFNPHEINLQDLAEQWAVTLEGMVRRQERDLAFDVVQGPDLPQKLFVDDKRIHQIVTNLLDNAVKYTSEGRVELRITNATSEDGAAGVALDVVDTGPGIKASQMDRIFDRFVQIDDNIDRASGGAGLGLAIAKELAEAMGMSLALHESGTEGSTFRLFVKTT